MQSLHGCFAEIVNFISLVLDMAISTGDCDPGLFIHLTSRLPVHPLPHEQTSLFVHADVHVSRSTCCYCFLNGLGGMMSAWPFITTSGLKTLAGLVERKPLVFNTFVETETPVASDVTDLNIVLHGPLPTLPKTLTPGMPMDEDEPAREANLSDPEDVNNGPTDIHFINLHRHPVIAVGPLVKEHTDLGDKATFIVWHEYRLFMDHVISRVNGPTNVCNRPRFFVTGQPGIGKWSVSLCDGFVLIQ